MEVDILKDKPWKENLSAFLKEPTRQNLRQLLNLEAVEDNDLDFKRELRSFDSLAKHILAMANKNGGAIVFGVDEVEKNQFSPYTLIFQAIDQQYQQLQSQNATNGVEGLFWSQDAYQHITKQGELFDTMLPELRLQYAGMYILFEDGNVIDADLDEDTLLDRVWDTALVRDRIAKYNSIFCHLVLYDI
jgi:Putative DNA-binding domain